MSLLALIAVLPLLLLLLVLMEVCFALVLQEPTMRLAYWTLIRGRFRMKVRRLRQGRRGKIVVL